MASLQVLLRELDAKLADDGQMIGIFFARGHQRCAKIGACGSTVSISTSASTMTSTWPASIKPNNSGTVAEHRARDTHRDEPPDNAMSALPIPRALKPGPHL
jgi:hypothetical protein